jgi:ubiquinone/menaquinone biosynthesis C-methylase UbiE
MVAGFAASAPNATLMAFARAKLQRQGACALDVGCGAARNAVPLAEMGWTVTGIDLSQPMLDAAAERARAAGLADRVRLQLAPMGAVPLPDASVDLIVAHGIWNLARSGSEFRAAVREAARVARPGAALFVFTFSRHTLPDSVAPVPGETFVFTQFSGAPQCFLTEAELLAELAAAGFTPDSAVPLREHNRPPAGALRAGGPVIYEGAFRFGGSVSAVR